MGSINAVKKDSQTDAVKGMMYVCEGGVSTPVGTGEGTEPMASWGGEVPREEEDDTSSSRSATVATRTISPLSMLGVLVPVPLGGLSFMSPSLLPF